MFCVGVVFGLVVVLHSNCSGIVVVVCSHELILYSYCIGLIRVSVLHSYCISIAFVVGRSYRLRVVFVLYVFSIRSVSVVYSYYMYIIIRSVLVFRWYGICIFPVAYSYCNRIAFVVYWYCSGMAFEVLYSRVRIAFACYCDRAFVLESFWLRVVFDCIRIVLVLNSCYIRVVLELYSYCFRIALIVLL